MTAMEWFDALQWIHIVLIVTILLVFACYIYVLVKITRLEFVGGLVGKRTILVFGILFGSLVVVYLFYNLYNIQPNGWVEISLLAGLVAATGTLALVTLQQAAVSTKMAEEMRNARYGALRPIIDIVEQPLESKELFKQGFDAKEGKFPKDWPCKLRNLGVGPAIELYSFIEGAEGKPRRWDFGTIPVAIGEEEMGYTHEMRLLLEQRGNHGALVAYYQDVYGNPFESIREVSIDKDKEAVNVGPLKVHSLPKKEHIND